MCEATAIIGAVGMAAEAGYQIYNAYEQDQAAQKNKAEAIRSAQQAGRQLSLRELQERQASGMTLLQLDREARKATAQANLSAGEAGVAGTSVDLLIADIEARRSESERMVEANLGNTVDQLAQQRAQVNAEAQSRANAVPGGDWGGVGIRIANSGAKYAEGYYRNREQGTRGGNLNQKGS